MVSIEMDVNLPGLSCVNSQLQQGRSWLLPLIRSGIFPQFTEGHSIRHKFSLITSSLLLQILCSNVSVYKAK